MIEISIVVPVYKVEKYLLRCVDSLIAQTCKNIEIILVDDGSPDKCPSMCDQFSKKDERIKVLHKANGGLSSARNAGMEIAQGKYIGFVDSDDAVDANMFEDMLEAAEQYNADFVMTDYVRIPSEGEGFLISKNLRGGIYNKSDIKKEIFPALIMGENIDYGPLLSVWNCIYRREFLEKNNITFANDVKWSEDNLFSAVVGYCAERFVYLKGKGHYYYYQNPGTITTSYRPGAWNVYKRMNEYMESFFAHRKDYDFIRQIKLHMIYYACNVMRMECCNAENTIDAKIKVRNILKDQRLINAFCELKMPVVPLKLKVQLLLMKYQCTSLLVLLIRR